MTEPNRNRETEERLRSGQSAAQGDTGDGNTGVPEFEQGISNRAGDKEGAEDVEELKTRTAKGSRGPEQQKGFGQGG